MTQTKDELWTMYMTILFVEALYWIVSIGTVFTNEFVLSANILTNDLTVFITVFQINFSLALLLTLNYINQQWFRKVPTDFELLTPRGLSNSKTNLNEHDDMDRLVQDEESSLGVNYKPSSRTHKSKSPGDLSQLFYINVPKKISLDKCKIVFPLSTLYIGMLLLNNYCLEYVGVAFYFISRSLTTVFNVAFTYFLMNEPVSRRALACCLLIIIGFILGIDQESILGSLSVIGVIFGVLSSLFTSLFTIYTKKILEKVDGDIWMVIMYNNINALILCYPLLLIHGDIWGLISHKVVDPWFWFLLSISGVMSFLISIVTNASIKYTSPLTHNISGTSKSCVQTCLAVIYNNEKKSLLWWISNLVILASSATYSRIKQLEMEQKSDCSNKPNLALDDSADFEETDENLSKLVNQEYQQEFKSATESCSIKFKTGRNSPA